MDTLFFALSKILFFLISPMTWIGLLLLLSIAIKRRDLGRKIGIISLLVFLFFSNMAIQNSVMRWWEIETPPASAIKQSYTYAIVLGGMSECNPATGKLIVERSIDRILQAVILYKAGKVKKIIITGGSGKLLNQSIKEATDIKNFCIQLGIPSEDILTETESRNTYENAKFTKKLFSFKTEKVLLITSAIHMRRSMAIFKKAGYQFDILSTDPLATPLEVDDYFLPEAKALDNWTIILKEWAGFIAYKLVGYL
ncbi:MAG TPA: YdcF family protein [Bacteroidales bacterium]|nr:YdcF family protein [Bacteroidales bacterium]HOK98361.1 YdcF family protein [Bacteroidales bacterium]HPO65228.1 YdcF family protein [Bacteroidales bacterium]